MTDPTPFTPQERDLIRREFMLRLSSARSLHEGILLRRWATGEKKGAPKVAGAVQTMLDRGLVELADLDKHWPVARFTSMGHAALRIMAADKRSLNPETHAQLIEEIAALPEGD